MVGLPATQLRASAHRYLQRRVERALLHGDPRPAQEPLAARRALGVGCLLAIVVAMGCALLAFVRPEPTMGAAPLLMSRRSGALYVRVDDVVHPVLNLASARLITAAGDDPRPVRDSDLHRTRRGPLLGIPGAPQALDPVLSAVEAWSVCDSRDESGPVTTAVIGADQSNPDIRTIALEQALLVSSESSGTTYLLHGGRRTAVRPEELALATAGRNPRRVSGLLLNAIPESPAAALPGRIAVLPDDAGTLCATWAGSAHAGGGIKLSVGTGLPLPVGGAAVALAQADGVGPALDAIFVPPGFSVYVRSVGVSGPAGGECYLITSTGVRFAIGDGSDARSLGLSSAAVAAPWPVLAGLPAGPQLSRKNALVAWDVVNAVVNAAP